MQCLIAGLAARLHDDVPEVEFHPRKSIFRIYRDTRFSKNKTPYKTNIAASFEMRGGRGFWRRPGFTWGWGRMKSLSAAGSICRPGRN